MGSILKELQEASYGGAFFFPLTTTTDGGRKNSVKRFVGTDRQIVEDLGLERRSYSIEGTISARYDTEGKVVVSYKQARDKLIAALEKGKPQTLVHPFEGRIRNLVAQSYSLQQNMNSIGSANITMDFAITEGFGIPIPTLNTLSEIASKVDAVADAAKKTIEKVSIASQFAENFKSMVDTAGKYIDKVKAVVKKVVAAADKINEFSNRVNKFSAGIADLVGDVTSFADSIVGVMSSMEGLYLTARSSFEVLKGMFDFGDEKKKTPILETTAGRIEKKKNQDIVNTAVQCLALCYCYRQSSLIDFETDTEIDEFSNILEDQYQKIVNSNIADQDLLDTLASLRLTIYEFFENQKLTARQIITVNTNPTSARLLAFTYYGSDELGDAITSQNDLANPIYLDGDVQIFSA